jgi:hypothetical protein
MPAQIGSRPGSALVASDNEALSPDCAVRAKRWPPPDGYRPPRADAVRQQRQQPQVGVGAVERRRRAAASAGVDCGGRRRGHSYRGNHAFGIPEKVSLDGKTASSREVAQREEER